jgi:TfuA protein
MTTINGTLLAIFAGPSLYGSPYRERFKSVLKPPVQDGGLLPIAQELPPGSAILIIDGYFGAGQALTITEISASIELGARLYGATSTGALRAVEAGPIGMIGIGDIYEMYRDGVYVSDEEVCLVHDEKYRPLSVPTINLRALCRLIVDCGVNPLAVAEFFRAAKAIHYRERSITGLRKAAAVTLSPTDSEILRTLLCPDALAAWNAKRQDAEKVIDWLTARTCEVHADTFIDVVPADWYRLLNGTNDTFA